MTKTANSRRIAAFMVTLTVTLIVMPAARAQPPGFGGRGGGGFGGGSGGDFRQRMMERMETLLLVCLDPVTTDPSVHRIP